MVPQLKENIIALTPIALKHIKAEARTVLPARNAVGARILAGTRRAREVKAKVLEEIKAKEKPGCVCDPKDLVKLLEAITTAVEVIYQTLKAIGVIVDGLYVGN
tara:strand:- start:1121 stop:1432 length:312 start_codon:yes stop_codon:yes gene_type:complete